MVGLLNGGAKALFGELLGGSYPAARLYTGEPNYDNEGTLQMGDGGIACKAKVDSATERMRTEPGFSQTDRSIFILAASFAGEAKVGHEIEILEGPYAGSKFGIASVDRPGGASYWLCRGAYKSG